MTDHPERSRGARTLPEQLRGLRLPIICAPMFLVSGPELVVAAAQAGLVGALPTLNARTVEQLDAWLTEITSRLAAPRPAGATTGAATGRAEGAPGWRGTWAANVISHRSNQRLADDLAVLAKHRPPVVITALGGPRRVVDEVHRWGGLVIADVNSVEFARKAADAGVDGLLLVASGAGGHTGQLSPFALVETVREFWPGLLVLSGAITTGRAVAAARVLGADLVSLGTRFIATEESLAPDAYRQLLVTSTASDLVCTNAFTGAWANMLRPSILKAGLDPDALGPGRKLEVSADPLAKSRPWADIWSAGHGVGLIHSVQPVGRVVDELESEYHSALSSAHEEQP
jgi:nitronate monooxygenase